MALRTLRSPRNSRISDLLHGPAAPRQASEEAQERATPHRNLAILAVLSLFLLGCVLTYVVGGGDGAGDDLSASYVAARLMATGHANSLYSHDLQDFSTVEDPAWNVAAEDGGFSGFLHPYVQTPAWAYLLQGLAMHVSFRVFNAMFSVLTALCFAGLLWIVARVWAPGLFDPYWIGLLAAGLFLSVPFRYAMFLTQTHILFLLLTVVGLILAERDRPVCAGALVAVAAAVKITPGLLVVYWVLTRRWKAAASLVVASAALLLLTVAASGFGVVAEYLREVHRVSGLLLLAYNNQSSAAWAMSWWYPQTESTAWYPHSLPPLARAASSLLVMASLVVGGLWDRGRKGGPPIGAAFAIVGTTFFTPLAWTHYAIVLILPVMMLLDQNLRLRSRTITLALVAIVALNFEPLAIDAQSGETGPLSLLRAHFFAGMICLAALAFLRSRVAGQTFPVKGVTPAGG